MAPHDNRYAPPKALELELPQETPEQCRHVEWACMLLWCGFGVSVLSSLLAFFKANGASAGIEQILAEVIGLVIAFALVFWCTLKLRAGRNWMRLLFTIVTVAGFAFLIIMVVILLSTDYGTAFFSGFFQAAPIETITMLGQFALSAVQVALINTPDARAWFAARRNRAAG